MSAIKPKLFRPKPIKPSFKLPRTQSNTFSDIDSDLSFDKLPVMAKAVSQKLPKENFFEKEQSLERLTNVPFDDDLKNIENIYNIEQELSSSASSVHDSDILPDERSSRFHFFDEVPFRPSNPMVDDEFWNNNDFFRTEEKHTYNKNLDRDEMADTRTSQSL